jgi:hypothetical protein
LYLYKLSTNELITNCPVHVFSLMAIMVLCPLPQSNLSREVMDDEHSPTPFAVSLVTSHCRRPRNLLRLVDLRMRPGHPLMMSSTWNSTSRDDVDFTMCVPPLYGNITAASDLVEFIEASRAFGAKKFLFYLESTGRELETCLREYEQLGLVELRPWKLPQDLVDEVHYHGQIMAITECLYRLMYSTKYLISQDLDEFVVPARTDDWQSMLDRIHAKPPIRSQIKWSSLRTLYAWLFLEITEDSIGSYNFRNRDFDHSSPADLEYIREADPLVKEYLFKTLVQTTGEVINQ